MRAVIVIVAALLVAGCVSGSSGTGSLLGSDVTAVVQQRSPQAGKLINEYRARNGLGPVSEDPRLMRAAAEHASDLAARSRVSHYGSDGSDPATRTRRAGYSFSNIGENVSAGRASLTEVIQAWIESAPHRANLVLDPATHFGLAHSFSPDSHYRHYWVLVLAEPEHTPPADVGTESGSPWSVQIGHVTRR